jgi:hypothetical protein
MLRILLYHFPEAAIDPLSPIGMHYLDRSFDRT